jgi:NTE family protein
MHRREAIDLVIAGGASHVVGLAGAASAIDLRRDVARVGGTSAGAIVAAALACGLTQRELRDLLGRFLGGGLLDVSPWPFHRYGLHKGDALAEALRAVFRGARMRETYIPLRVVVCDLWTRQPVVIDSLDPAHAELEIVDVLRCSAAIPFWFRAHHLHQWRGSDRLFVDGGAAANFAMHVFDDEPSRRTVGVRLLRPSVPQARPVRGVVDFVGAVVELMLWASDNAHISSKRFADVVQVPAEGSGLDFSLSPAEIDRRWSAGVDAGRRWCDA